MFRDYENPMVNPDCKMYNDYCDEEFGGYEPEEEEE